MKNLFFVYLLSITASASTDQCPSLAGKFFCKGVAGSHKDMNMTIKEKKSDANITYEYLYEQEGEEPLALSFFASNEGTENPSQGKMIGKCYNGFYFNSDDGQLRADSYLNYKNSKGNYEVIINESQQKYLECNAL